MIATGGQPKTLEAFTNIGPDHVTTYHNVQDFMKMEALIGAIHYYVSTCIAQNLILLPNFSSKQKDFFFNITFWLNFHAVVWYFLKIKKNRNAQKICENVVVDKKVLT